MNEVLKRHGPIAAIALMMAGLVVWEAKAGAAERKELAAERKNMFDTQMEYVMDVRIKMEHLERACAR